MEGKEINKLAFYHKCPNKDCRICNKPIYLDEKFECVSRKRKASFMFHTDCLIKAAKGEI